MFGRGRGGSKGLPVDAQPQCHQQDGSREEVSGGGDGGGGDAGGVQADARRAVLAERGAEHRGLDSVDRFLGSAGVCEEDEGAE